MTRPDDWTWTSHDSPPDQVSFGDWLMSANFLPRNEREACLMGGHILTLSGRWLSTHWQLQVVTYNTFLLTHTTYRLHDCDHVLS